MASYKLVVHMPVCILWGIMGSNAALCIMGIMGQQRSHVIR